MTTVPTPRTSLSALDNLKPVAPAPAFEHPHDDPAHPAHAPEVPTGEVRTPADVKIRVINFFAVVLPLAGLGAAVWLSWGWAFDWVYLAIMVGMFLVTGLGITVGFHRMATHLSFRSPAWVRYLLAVAGSMAVQGPVIEWCAEHRKHHQHSDLEGDPHSPHMGADGSWGEGILATLRGAWHAHVGWLFTGETREHKQLEKYTRDLLADRALVAADRQFLLWVVLGLIIPAVLGGLLTMSWRGVLLGFLWGGLARVALVHHVTWSVNSVCHLWGSRDYRSHDESRNNPIVGILAMGEGWHNNHHAFPTSAKHGLSWWQFDLSYLVIRALWLLGLAKDVRVPDKARREAKRVR